LTTVGEVELKAVNEGSEYTDQFYPEQQEIERFAFEEVEEEAALTVEQTAVRMSQGSGYR